MPVYRKCTVCGRKVLDGTLCKCEEQKKKDSYKDYKRRRMLDKQEKDRQQFYSSSAWLRLSENIKNHFFGLCIICWFKGLIQESEYTHHVETIKDRFDLKLDEKNLVPLCHCCHKKVHRMMDKSDKDKINIQNAIRNLIQKFDEEFY